MNQARANHAPAVTRVHACVHDGPTAAATAWTPADPPDARPISEVPGPPRRQDFLNRVSEVGVLPGALVFEVQPGGEQNSSPCLAGTTEYENRCPIWISTSLRVSPEEVA
jgi:hypothetical protein